MNNTEETKISWPADSPPVIGILIATHGRSEELSATLNAICSSSLMPLVCVVVDSSETKWSSEQEGTMRLWLRDKMEFIYLATDKKSLTAQRNQGLDYLNKYDLDYIQVLDDDTSPEVDFLEKLATVLWSETQTLGVSGITAGTSSENANFWLRLPFVFSGLDSLKPGSISRAGVGIPVLPTGVVVDSDWLIGCSMWKARVFSTIRYDSEFLGSALFEDVEFSARVGKVGRLRVDTSAILRHSMSPINRPPDALYHYRFSRNRWQVLVALGMTVPRQLAMIQSVLLMFVVSVGKAAVEPSRAANHLKSSLNTIYGYWDALMGKPPK